MVEEKVRLIYLEKKNMYAIVDEEDYERVSKYHWYAVYDGHNWYAKTKIKYLNYFLHRMILNLGRGKEDTRFPDHINGNGLDCRKSNMRLSNHKQNGGNRKKMKGNCSSKFCGVSKTKRNKYECRIIVNYRHIYLGIFENEIEAAQCRDIGSLIHYGEFARLNLPELKQQYIQEIYG